MLVVWVFGPVEGSAVQDSGCIWHDMVSITWGPIACFPASAGLGGLNLTPSPGPGDSRVPTRVGDLSQDARF